MYHKLSINASKYGGRRNKAAGWWYYTTLHLHKRSEMGYRIGKERMMERAGGWGHPVYLF